jgi:glycosyltransferase involved in cell wall biosynthesis
VPPLRIVLFTECYRPIQNGVVAAIDALSDALRAHGHEVFCITPTMPGYHETDEFVVRIPSLPLPTATAYRLTLPLLPHRAVARAMQNASIVHAHSPFVTGWMGLRAARRYGTPLVFTYHTRLEDYAHYVPFEESMTRSAVLTLTRTYANAADAVIVPTPAMETHLREIGVTSRIDVVPSGIDVRFFAKGKRRDELREHYGVAAGEKMVLTVGRLAKEKNLELAIEAFATLGDPVARLVVVGDGPDRERLEAAASRAGVANRTHFAGALARAELPDTYASADVFLFTSRSETQGLVLAEALATGLPVVAVDAPATRDVLGSAGVLAPEDARALAEALAAVLATGARNRPESAQRFDAAVLAVRVLEVYTSLIGRASRAG